MIGWFDAIHTESRQDHHRMKQHLDVHKVGKPLSKHMKGIKTLREHHDKKQHHRVQRSVHDVIEKEARKLDIFKPDHFKTLLCKMSLKTN